MADTMTKKQRSFCMSRIRGRDTKPELKIKRLMKKLGFSHQPKGIIGRPDFANKKEKIAVFVDGCFWHGCPKHCKKPKTNKKFWYKKIAANVKRDKQVNTKLKKDGWRVIRIWEHKIK